MSTEQILLIIIGGVGAVWTVFKVLLPRFVDAKIKADEYERARGAFREDKTFEMLEDTLEHWKQAHDDERADAKAAQQAQIDLIATIAQVVANIERQTDTIRILTREVSVMSDRIRTIEDKLDDKLSENVTRRIVDE